MRFLKDIGQLFTHLVTPSTSRQIRCQSSQEETISMSSLEGELRRIASRFVTLFTFVLIPLFTSAQDFTQTINRSANFEKPNNLENELRVYNINGSVTVEGYEGNEIQITAVEEIEGTSREVELTKEELSLRVDQEGDLVLIYIDAPFITLKRKGERINYHIDRWNNWDDDDYRFLFDITIRVPKETHIYASTINRGTVTINNTNQRIHASNVNGELNLKGISGPTKARTVNGDITATYLESPDKDSDYQTVNGTIEVKYPDDLSADVKFKSMHGDLYTDFQNIERLQAQVKKDTKTKRGKTTYRLDRFSPIRIGNGGPIFSFEVLNGDVYVKRIKS